jgi:hypothetical protein
VNSSSIIKNCRDKPRVKNNLILHFNFILDNKAKFFTLNESSLETFIDQLENLTQVKDTSYWLTLARIYELSLLCTENYANNAELTLVGDLLINPRLILVHVKGESRPIVKKRHIPLTEQFKAVPDVVQWLKTETSLETKKEALLPHLHQKLERSGYFCREFLDFMKDRQNKIVDLTVFLAAAGVRDSLTLYCWRQQATPETLEMAGTKFCSCNIKIYTELGRLAREFAQGSSIPENFKRAGSIPLSPALPSSWREQPSAHM